MAKVHPELAAEIAAIAEGTGCELLHLETVRNILRIVLDRPGSIEDRSGVTHEDCVSVSRQVSALLDVSDFGGARYVLEVSSPGLDRQLYGPRDYRRFIGRSARITFKDPATGKKRTVVGRLAGFEEESDAQDGAGAVSLHETEHDETLTIPLPNIQMARLEIEL